MRYRLARPLAVFITFTVMSIPAVARLPYAATVSATVSANAPQRCLAPDGAGSALRILSPAEGAAFSETVPLSVDVALNPPDSVAACAAYPSGDVVVASLSYQTGWTATWDAPHSQTVSLRFVAQYPSGQTALVGTVQRVMIDRAPPTSAATIVGAGQYTAPGGATYVLGDTPIALAAADPPLDDGSPGSGATLFYRVDDGAPVTYTAPLTLNGRRDGPHAIAYWAADRAGNVGAVHTLTPTLDTTRPAVTPLITGNFDAAGVAYTPVTVAFAMSDAGSGLDTRQTGYAIGSGWWQTYAPGQAIVVTSTAYIAYRAVDMLGNSAIGTLPITVATPTPTSAPILPLPSVGVPTAPNTGSDPGVAATPTRGARSRAGGTIEPTATRTPRPTPTERIAPTPTATQTPRPTPTPRPTQTPRPAPTRATVLKTTAPRATPTWPPIDGPPIPRRTPVTASTGAQGTLTHVHTLPVLGQRHRTTRKG